MSREKSGLTLALLIIIVALLCIPISVYAWTTAPDILKYVNSRFNEADLPGKYEGTASLNIYNNDKTVKWDMMVNNSYAALKAIREIGYPNYATAKANIIKAGSGFDIDLTISANGKVEFHETLHAEYVRSHQDAKGNHRLYQLYYNGAKLDKSYIGFANSAEAQAFYTGKGMDLWNLLDWFENDGEHLVKTFTYVELLSKGNVYVLVLNDLQKVADLNEDLAALKNTGVAKVPGDGKKIPPWLVLTGGAAAALIALKILAKILKSLAGGAKSKSAENNNDENKDNEIINNKKDQRDQKDKKEKKDRKLKKYLLQISKPEVGIIAGEKGAIGITAWYVDAEGSQGIATNAEIKIMMDSVPSGVTLAPSSGYGKITCSISIPQDEKEGSYTVAVMAEADGNSISANFILKIHEARNPVVDVDEDFVYLLCKSGD